MRRIFISYAREDLETAERLYRDLERIGARPWLDKENLLPGQDWKREIDRTIRKSSHFLALISVHSVNKRGYVQKELRQGLEVLEEIPPDEIFIIPCRVDNSKPKHDSLARLHWVDLFPSYEDGFSRIAQSLGLAGAAKASKSRRSEPIPTRMVDLRSPANLTRLVREAAFAQFAREAVGNRVDAENVLATIEPGLRDPVVMDREEVRSALDAAKEIAEAPDAEESFSHVRRVLAPLLAILPEPEKYFERLGDAPFEARARAIEVEYNKVNNVEDPARDFLAFIYLRILQHIGEHEAALSLVKKRLLTIPPHTYRKAFVATAELAQELLGDDFRRWYDANIRGKTAESL